MSDVPYIFHHHLVVNRWCEIADFGSLTVSHPEARAKLLEALNLRMPELQLGSCQVRHCGLVEEMLGKCEDWLVVEPTPFEKYESKWESSPIFRVKIKNI